MHTYPLTPLTLPTAFHWTPSMTNEQVPFTQLEDRDRDALVATTRKLLADVQGLSSRITAVQEIATAINRSLELSEILEIVSRQAKWILDFEACSISLIEQQTEPQVLSVLGDPHDMPPLPDDMLIKKAMETGQAQLHPLPFAQIIIALQSEGQSLGTINFVSRRTAYSLDDVRIANLLGLQLAGAIRNARRFAEERRLVEELKSAETLRDTLWHMLAHDLRTPLTALLNSLDIIERYSNNDRADRFFQLAKLSGNRMTGMIDDMLMVGKLESGEPVLDKSLVDVRHLLCHNSAGYRLQSEMKGLTFICEADESVNSATFDPQLILRVIDNLVGNAIKYNFAPGTVELRASATEDELTIIVKDDGMGIPPEKQKMIFEKFTQLDSSEGRKGVGLGLAFCRMVVEAHGGTIRVCSNGDQGSTFAFMLPICHDEKRFSQ